MLQTINNHATRQTELNAFVVFGVSFASLNNFWIIE